MLGKFSSNYVDWLFFPARFVLPRSAPAARSPSTGSPTTLRIPGWETLEFVADSPRLEDLVRQVGRTYLGGAGNAFLVPLFGRESAFTLDGPAHRLARRLIGQAVDRSGVARTLALMPDHLGRVFGTARPGERVAVGAGMRRVTMLAMCRVILGDIGEHRVEDLHRRFEPTTGFFANFVSYNRSFWSSGRRLSVGSEVARRRRRIDEAIFSLIAERRDRLVSRDQAADELIDDRADRDLLSHLVMRQAEHGYSDIFIRDNLVATIAAGYDTTASALTWMMFWLGTQHDIRRRLFAGHHADEPGNAALAAAFVSETMRYCPPLEILPRRPVAGEEAGDAELEDQPTLVCPCPHRAHHDPTVYGDPGAFRPERFLEKKFSPTEFFPFGMGNRLCLGVVLAPAIMNATLAWFLERRLYLRFDKARFQPIRRNVSLWPSFRNRATFVSQED